uniref:Uncharacterized protein n=1 Tax=Tetranychus urticae TaxID=32264 RepID=T1KWR7_TETUR
MLEYMCKEKFSLLQKFIRRLNSFEFAVKKLRYVFLYYFRTGAPSRFSGKQLDTNSVKQPRSGSSASNRIHKTLVASTVCPQLPYKISSGGNETIFGPI